MEDMTQDTIPPTDPVSQGADLIGIDAPPRKEKRTRKPKSKANGTKIEGSSLVMNLDEHCGGVRTEYSYWVGVIPDCPVEAVDMAGINFPKINELIVKDPNRTGKTRRIPLIGAVVQLTEDKIKRMMERMPRTVIRFTDKDPGQKDEPGTGQNIGDLYQRPRRGQLITIPTADEVQSRSRRGKATHQYVQGPDDQPAARYMFAVLCENQKDPKCGNEYPPALETSGLEWPEKLQE